MKVKDFRKNFPIQYSESLIENVLENHFPRVISFLLCNSVWSKENTIRFIKILWKLYNIGKETCSLYSSITQFLVT